MTTILQELRNIVTRPKYFLNYLHTIGYFIVYYNCYNILWNVNYHSYNNLNLLTPHRMEGYTPPAPPLLVAILLGWSLYGIVTIGHDAVHHSYSPCKPLNRLVSFIVLDMVVSPSRWTLEHNHNHHHYLKSSKDTMNITKSKYLLIELKNLISSMRKVGKETFMDEVYRFPFLISMLHLPLVLLPVIYITILLCLGYLTYITHSLSTTRRVPPKPRSREYILDNTWDVFPDSHFWNFIFGSINVHASHHCYPMATRWELITHRSHLLARKYPNRYRVIKTWRQLLYLYRHRHDTVVGRPNLPQS